jgi:hypothetical protein
MTSRAKKIAIRLTLTTLVVVLAAVAFGIYRGVREFSVEDNIHGDFFPVVRALYDYQDEHGSPAVELTDLLPKYLPAIPKSHLVDAIDYKVSKDGENWEFRLHSKALSPTRFYVSRSDQKYTTEEESRVLLRYHVVWTVLRE